jgi:uncharacterized GH25 family protein
MKQNVLCKYFVGGFLAIFMLSFTSMVCAHNLWLNVSHSHVDVGGTTQAFMGYGHSHPFQGFMPPEDVEKFQLITPSGRLELLQPETQGTEIKIQEAGTYLAAVERKASFYTKTPSGSVRKSKKGIPDAISCSRSEKFAKTIFVGEKAGGDSYRKEVGHSLEIIPLEDPATLKQGDFLPLKVLFQGKAAPKYTFIYGSYLGFSTEYKTYAYAAPTDNEGIAKLRILTQGTWQVAVYHTVPAPDPAECDKYNYISILTFVVR